jgi:hypothetical protein
MSDDIVLTRDEALTILKQTSMVEGFLFSVKDSSIVIDLMDYTVNLLTVKLGGESE